MFFQVVSSAVTRASGGPPPGGPISFSSPIATCLPNWSFEAGNPAVGDLPTTAGSGDFVIAALFYDSTFTNDIVITPSGWTKLFHAGDATPDAQVDFYYRVFNGTEGSTISFTADGTLLSRDIYIYSFIVNNIDTSNPFPVLGTTSQTAFASTLDVTGITATSDGRVLTVVGYDGGDGDPFTFTAGWTEQIQAECDDTSSGLGVVLAYKDILSGASSGTFTVSAVVSDGIVGKQIFMKQA